MTTRRGATPIGRLITFEGPDGSGKTTQAARLHATLREAGFAATLTREPGGTATGERIREILLDRRSRSSDGRSDAFLFNAARAQLVAEVVRPAIARGDVVISARFADSTLAYQGYGAGLPLDELRALERFATGGLVPDLTILLDLPVSAGLARKAGDEITRFEAAYDAAFHGRVGAGFRAIAAADPGRIAVVDATEPADLVFARVLAVVAARLPELAVEARPRALAANQEPVANQELAANPEPVANRDRTAADGERQPGEPERPRLRITT
ncbi:MAG: dTMP kinase [Candidatus Limnocylindrales bacterium]